MKDFSNIFTDLTESFFGHFSLLTYLLHLLILELSYLMSWVSRPVILSYGRTCVELDFDAFFFCGRNDYQLCRSISSRLHTMGQQNSTPEESDSIVSERRVAQNVLFIWLDANLTPMNPDTEHSLSHLRSVFNEITLFIDPQKCLEFLLGVKEKNVFVIISGLLAETVVPTIHSLEQVSGIYIFCLDKHRQEKWTEKWPKVEGIHTEIGPLCQALQQAAEQCNQDSVSFHFSSLDRENTESTDLNQLNASFMYTQLFVDALLDMKHNDKAIQDLVKRCRTIYASNPVELALIEEFSRDYRPENAIWWYMRHCFVYQMVNRALGLLDASTIVDMGFFIHDLHRQIQHKHQKQVSTSDPACFTVYRGQGMPINSFMNLRKIQGGLLSCNTFLSTSHDRQLSLKIARRAIRNNGMVGIVFTMNINPRIISAPFANVKRQSRFGSEMETLFSTHTVFRIGSINQLDESNQLFEVEMALTAENDLQLRALADHVKGEVQGCTGWDRIGMLLIQVGQLDKAGELYRSLLNQDPEGHYHHELGCIMETLGNYQEAVHYYKEALSIYQKNLPPNHPHLAQSYSKIGSVWQKMNEYSKALPFYETALEIQKKSLSPNHPSLAASYSKLGSVWQNMDEYSKALPFYEKALEIDQRNLPTNHPDLANSYFDIGMVYAKMEEYPKALSFFEKALFIREKALPASHPDIQSVCSNINSMKMKLSSE